MTASGARSYALVLPPGFALISAHGDITQNVRNAVRGMFGKISDDRTRGRVRILERSLAEAVSGARERGVVDVVLPLGTPWQLPVSISCVFAPGRGTPTPADAAGSTVVVTRAGEARREVVEGDGTSAPQLPGVELPGAAPGGTLRTVHHVWEVPASGVDRLVGTFTIAGSPDSELRPLVEALTELGDTIMASLAWRGAPVDTPTSEAAST